MSAEAAISLFDFDLRRAGKALAIGTLLLGVAYSCDGGNKPRSPLDTNGTEGSGYTPPSGWRAGYPQGGTRYPGDNHRFMPEANILPGTLLGSEGIIEIDITPEAWALEAEQVPTPISGQ